MICILYQKELTDADDWPLYRNVNKKSHVQRGDLMVSGLCLILGCGLS
jgi:hypothetical protein